MPDFNAMQFVSGSKADAYVRKIDLPGLATVGRGPEFIDKLVSSRLSALRPQFAQLRDYASIGVTNRFGGETFTGQRASAIDSANAGIAGQVAGVIAGAEQQNEEIRRQAESAYMGHLAFMDNLSLQAQTAEEQLREAEKQRGFGFGDLISLASVLV